MTQASILIVDDWPANLLALESLLEPLGQRIVRANAGHEALGRAEVEDFALVLMDVNMPGLDGFQTVARLRTTRFGRDVPVIFLTAVHDAHDYRARGYAVGAVDYLAKPFEPELLVAKVGWFVSLWQRGVLIKRQEEVIRERELQAARALAQREVAEAATRAKDDFLAMVTHDLLSPLSAIIGWTELMKKQIVEPERIPEVFDTILRCAMSQRRLIEDLLDVSRIVAGRLEAELTEVDLGAVVEHVVQELMPAAQSRNLELVVSGERHLSLRGDERLLERLVNNLVQNALKFSSARGHVSISLEHDAASGALLRVRDWGLGIPKDFLPHIFERFQQGAAARGRGGLGLGLAIARHIAEVHGGTIEATSSGEGQGSTFTLRLPMALRAAV